MVYSASNAVSRDQRGDSYHFLKMQLLWCFIGSAVMVFTAFFNHQNYQKLAWLALAVSGLLLIMVYIPKIGLESGGGRRWIKIWKFSFQPVELAKLSFVIYVASFLNRNGDNIRDLGRGILPTLIVFSVFFALIYKQPDLGSLVIMGALVFAMLFVGGARLYHMILLMLLFSLLVAVEIVREPFRIERLMTFINPWKDPEGSGYHIVQSYFALGSGGILGRGLGAGIQKLHYLPTPHTDFIFAVIGEELGFIGSAFMIILFMVVVWRGIHIALSTRNRFASLLAFGISFLIGIQAAINIGVVTGSLPTKGLTLPFISFGGSSMLISLASIGILLNISRMRGSLVDVEEQW